MINFQKEIANLEIHLIMANNSASKGCDTPTTSYNYNIKLEYDSNENSFLNNFMDIPNEIDLKNVHEIKFEQTTYQHFVKADNIKREIFICPYSTQENGGTNIEYESKQIKQEYSPLQLYGQHFTNTCDICREHYNTREELAEHRFTHTYDSRSTCLICHRTYKVKKDVKCHILRAHMQRKPFVCDICHKRFSGTNILNAHKRTHNQLKPFACDVCHKRFNHSGHLNTHKRLHSAVRQLFKCDLCERLFDERSNLTRHVRTHTGERPYECDICHKRCSSTSDLTKHKRIHSGDRPYQCDVCARTFAQSNALKSHMVAHVAGASHHPFQCDMCHKRLTTNNSLLRHMRTHMTVGKRKGSK